MLECFVYLGSRTYDNRYRSGNRCFVEAEAALDATGPAQQAEEQATAATDVEHAAARRHGLDEQFERRDVGPVMPIALATAGPRT